MFGKKGFLRKKSNEMFINMLSEPKLAEIGRIHGTDKVDQNHTFNNLSYLDIYERYFEKFKDRDVSILEIGVRAGESLRTWKSYLVGISRFQFLPIGLTSFYDDVMCVMGQTVQR